MKKTFLFLILFASASSFLHAQKLKEGDLSVLKNETNICISVDYSKMIFNGLTEKDYIASLTAEQHEQWELATSEFLTTFVSSFNGALIFTKLDLVAVVSSDGTKYKITVVPLVFDGSYNMKAEVILTEQDSDAALAKIAVSGFAYRFGTRIHKAKGSFKTAAVELAVFLAKKLK
ncbi:MAG: hypothetical protein LBB41_06800 [Prevotellaceae bacterium]|jgi:hypothetical protein|nr:hypothetical protein [Prevotellaceae bacterium]